MNLNWNGQRPLLFFNCCFKWTRPHMNTHLAVYRATFPSAHEINAKKQKTHCQERDCAFQWAAFPCSEGVCETDPEHFRISCCCWIFICNICWWNILALSVHVSYYSACRPSGMGRFQKNNSSIFMWFYAFINVAGNCFRSSICV